MQHTTIKAKLSPAVRLEIIRGLGCCVPGCRSDTPIELHHVRTAANSGTGMKPSDMHVVGLCAHHHRIGHHVGWKTFQKRYGVDFAGVAEGNALIDGPMP